MIQRLLSLVGILLLGGSLWGGAVTTDYQEEPTKQERAVSFLEDGSYERDELLINSVPMLDDERHIVVVICSYNNAQYYKWNLDSVFAQQYKNYHVIYVDDCSADNTGLFVEYYVNQEVARDKFIMYHNAERRKALANLYYAIHTCKSTDIILILDGDDRFAHGGVLQRINQEYANPNTWLTYGNFREYPSGHTGFCRAYPAYVIHKNSFRLYPDTPSHLRTFYAGLFHKIKKDDLLFKGDFFPVTYDLAIMFPMVEMARLHHRYIPEILVEYNGTNPINDHKQDGKKLQRKCDMVIRSRLYYTEIENPF